MMRGPRRHEAGASGADPAALAGLVLYLDRQPGRDADLWLMSGSSSIMLASGLRAWAGLWQAAGAEMYVPLSGRRARESRGDAGERREQSLRRPAADARRGYGSAGDGAERAKAHADPEARTSSERIGSRTTLAATLHAGGRAGERASAVRERPRCCKLNFEPHYPLLYSSQGYRYCDLLLAEAARYRGAQASSARR